MLFLLNFFGNDICTFGIIENGCEWIFMLKKIYDVMFLKLYFYFGYKKIIIIRKKIFYWIFLLKFNLDYFRVRIFK